MSPFLVTYGNHTTLRVHGFGKGGDSRITVNDEDDDVQQSNLEMGTEWVQVDMRFYTWHDYKLIRNLHRFDLFLLENEKDYDCYKRAVTQLFENNERVECDFLKDSTRSQLGILNKTLDHLDLLNWKLLNKEFIIVISVIPSFINSDSGFI